MSTTQGQNARTRHLDDIININVCGKKYTVRRIDLCADPRSKLAEIFRPGSTKILTTDKGGNIYLDRDPKIFRHILAYLRMKKEKFAASLALPSKPDDLAKLVGECEALNLAELKDLALEMLQTYQRTDEQHFATSYVQVIVRDYDAWHFDHDNQYDGFKKKKTASHDEENHIQLNAAYEAWENL
uniref:Potassium channel tetramerisation-type BTB domain-containing protein n=1 Tax=Acrobeloides nanus TaxID=290746 RepID=A0A914DI31_9BILA